MTSALPVISDWLGVRQPRPVWRKSETVRREKERERERERVTLENLYFVCQLSSPLSSSVCLTLSVQSRLGII